MSDEPRSPTAERPESLIEALNDSWPLVEFTDAWRGLSAEDQLSRARKWLAAVPADSPRPEPLFLGDEAHPQHADYIATNLLYALEQVPNTGDWHGELRQWCERVKTGKIPPNPWPDSPRPEERELIERLENQIGKAAAILQAALDIARLAPPRMKDAMRAARAALSDHGGEGHA